MIEHIVPHQEKTLNCVPSNEKKENFWLLTSLTIVTLIQKITEGLCFLNTHVAEGAGRYFNMIH